MVFKNISQDLAKSVIENNDHFWWEEFSSAQQREILQCINTALDEKIKNNIFWMNEYLPIKNKLNSHEINTLQLLLASNNEQHYWIIKNRIQGNDLFQGKWFAGPFDMIKKIKNKSFLFDKPLFWENSLLSCLILTDEHLNFSHFFSFLHKNESLCEFFWPKKVVIETDTFALDDHTEPTKISSKNILEKLENVLEKTLHKDTLETLVLNNITLNTNIDKLLFILGKFSSFLSLSLKNTKIKNLPPSIFSLSWLTALDLSDNELTRFPSELSQLTKLTHLFINNNPGLFIDTDTLKDHPLVTCPSLEIVFCKKTKVNKNSIIDEINALRNERWYGMITIL